MGYAYYTLPDGREAGYGVEAECDAPGCQVRIDRGLGYLCGRNPDGHKDAEEPGCGNYYCRTIRPTTAAPTLSVEHGTRTRTSAASWYETTICHTATSTQATHSRRPLVDPHSSAHPVPSWRAHRVGGTCQALDLDLTQGKAQT